MHSKCRQSHSSYFFCKTLVDESYLSMSCTENVFRNLRRGYIGSIKSVAITCTEKDERFVWIYLFSYKGSFIYLTMVYHLFNHIPIT